MASKKTVYKQAPIPQVEADEHARRFFAALDAEERDAAEVGEKLRPFGFDFHHSGGGCTAWVLREERGSAKGSSEIWVTDGQAKAPAKLSEPCFVSVMPNDCCEETMALVFPTVRAFLKVAVAFRGNYRDDVKEE